MKNRIRLFSLALIAIVALSFASTVAVRQTVAQSDENVIVIGAIIARAPGVPAPTAGVTIKSAERQINEHLAAGRNPRRIRVEIRETDRDPDRALVAIRELYALGARIIVGPETSGEIAAIKTYAESNGIILVSHGSTAVSLAQSGDNLFRLAPDDRNQGAAIARLMAEDGIKAVVPIWRGDVYGNDLAKAVTDSLQGAVALDGAAFAPSAFDAPDVVAGLEKRVSAAVSQYGAGSVAVFIVAIDAIHGIMAEAGKSEVLGSVRWYGSDGSARNLALVEDPVTAAFALKVGFANALFNEVDNQDEAELLGEEVRAATTYGPQPYALLAYDATVLAALTMVAVERNAGVDAIKQTIINTAKVTYGVSGNLSLNAAGDRIANDYEFWAIRPLGDGLSWRRVALYENDGVSAPVLTRIEVSTLETGPRATP